MAKSKIDPVMPAEKVLSKADQILKDLFADLHQGALHLGNPEIKGPVPFLASRLKAHWHKMKEYLEAEGIYSEREMRGEKKPEAAQ